MRIPERFLHFTMTADDTDAVAALKQHLPDSDFNVSGHTTVRPGWWQPLCHADCTACDLRKQLHDARGGHDYRAGEVLPQCGHGKDLVFEEWHEGRVPAMVDGK
ncbi:hypothetical protein [Myxococcus sp. CA040A]|uniref:hypothetical protein n=1 Tax=Myxococcus sp. CA040A TaxID=2741738 RepID=UPI00157A2707|nr:hypothetical protein [Myxococcus sp. CA040A]NTX07052.1 hypothetical protein [Myxococcus sp. CA040A]